MKPSVSQHRFVILVFIVWGNVCVPFFHHTLVFWQTDESTPSVPETDPVMIETIYEQEEQPVELPLPETLPTPEQTSQPEDTTIPVPENEQEVVVPTSDTQIPTSDANLEIPLTEQSELWTEQQESMPDTEVLFSDTQQAIPSSDSEPLDTAPENDLTTKEVVQTIYEPTQSGEKLPAYTESVTVLTNQDLTVIIPEHTEIRTAEGAPIAVESLELIPDPLLPAESTITITPEITPEAAPLIQTTHTETTIYEWVVAVDPAEFIIPEFSEIEEVQTPEIDLSPVLPESDWATGTDIITDTGIAPQASTDTAQSLQTAQETPSPTNTTNKMTQLLNDPMPSEEKTWLQETFEFGIPDKHLVFSEPIMITYAVPYPDGAVLQLQVQHAGEAVPWIKWLSTNNTVTCAPDGTSSVWGTSAEVIWGKVTFFTCGASTFTVIYTWWASAPNFVDNQTKDFTGLVMTWVDFPTWSVLIDADILIDFRPIDNESPTGPRWITNCYPGEKSFQLIHPDGTTVNLANAGTYTTPFTNCPQAQILYDQSWSTAIVGGAWNLTGQARIPVGDLNTLNGKSPFGTRTLRAWDNALWDGLIIFWFDLTLKNIECGDGIISSGEVCDDANEENDDGCTLSCEIEAGRQCSWAPSVCTEIPVPTWLRLRYEGSLTWALFEDISGSWFHGTNFNGVTTGNQNGETVMCFNGTTQYIQRATNLVTTYPFTMSTWMKSDTTAGLHGVVSMARSSSTNRMRNIEHNGTTIRQNAQNTTAIYTNATTPLTTTWWFLVTTVYNSNTSRQIYVNWVLEATNTTSVTYSSNAANRINIWRLADSTPTNYFDGCVDDVRIYSTALTSWQIYEIYAKPANLTTSFTTSSSPQLTWAIEWPLDTITITVSGNTYTWINLGNGTWTVSWGVISPALVSGTYTTTLTVTNPYGRAVVYTSSFVAAVEPTGDYCIAWPSSINFPTLTTSSTLQTWFTSSSGYFQLIDGNGANSGYYTTLQVTALSGTYTTIPTTWLARQSTWISLLSWTANTGVVLGSAFSGYSIASGTVTFIKRDPAPNSGRVWTYGAILQLRVVIPAYFRPSTYTGTITYTLYEN